MLMCAAFGGIIVTVSSKSSVEPCQAMSGEFNRLIVGRGSSSCLHMPPIGLNIMQPQKLGMRHGLWCACAGLWDVLYGPAFLHWGGPPAAPGAAPAPAAGGTGPSTAPPAAAAPPRTHVAVRLALDEAAGTVTVVLHAAARPHPPAASSTAADAGARSEPMQRDGQGLARGMQRGHDAGEATVATQRGSTVERAAQVREGVVALTERAAAGEGQGQEDTAPECGKVCFRSQGWRKLTLKPHSLQGLCHGMNCMTWHLWEFGSNL